jgi:hypothetical protein
MGDFVLSITTSNVVWWDKNVKTTSKEEVNTIFDLVPRVKQWPLNLICDMEGIRY